MKKIVIGLVVLLFGIQTEVFAGQNASAAILIDLNYTTSGDQGVIAMAPQYVGYTLYLEVRVSGASNLDTYEFDLNFPTSDLTYVNAWSDNFPPSSEVNFLKTAGGAPIGWTVDTSVPGVVNVAYTLPGTDESEAPEGAGLLAVVAFTYKVAGPGNLTFGNVDWYDNNGVHDVCTNKGDASLPVQLSNMTASASRKSGITLTWQTESELNCAGFHVWKSEQEISGYRKITSTLIPGHGNTSTANMYSHIDKEVEDNVIYWYKIEELSTDGRSIFMGPVSAIGIKPVPKEFALSQNYPNPFNPETTFDYQLPEDTDVLICIYNTLGKRVKTIVNRHQEAGYYTETWKGLNEEGRKVSSGIYLLSIETKEFHSVKKISLMR